MRIVRRYVLALCRRFHACGEIVNSCGIPLCNDSQMLSSTDGICVEQVSEIPVTFHLSLIATFILLVTRDRKSSLTLVNIQRLYGKLFVFHKFPSSSTSIKIKWKIEYPQKLYIQKIYKITIKQLQNFNSPTNSNIYSLATDFNNLFSKISTSL